MVGFANSVCFSRLGSHVIFILPCYFPVFDAVDLYLGGCLITLSTFACFRVFRMSCVVASYLLHLKPVGSLLKNYFNLVSVALWRFITS